MKGKKHIFTALALLVIAIATLGVSIAPSVIQTLFDARVELTINSEASNLKNEPLLKDGVTYVPLRECAENLGFQVAWDEETKTIDVDTYHKTVPNLVEAEIVAEQGAIPDEATAISVGKAILEAAMGRSVEYQDGEREFYLTATYYKKDNAWRVDQAGRYEGKAWYGTNFYTPFVVLNKNTGEVTSMNLYPQAELRTPMGRQEDGTLIYPKLEELH